MQKGDIYYANLNPVVGSEQGGIRPVLIIQNDTGNKYSPAVIVAPITSKAKRSGLPTHATLQLHGHQNIVLLEQIRTIARSRLMSYIGRATASEMAQVDNAACISLDLPPHMTSELLPANALLWRK